MYLYGRFLTTILADDDKGHLLLDKAQALSLVKSKNKQKEMLGGKESMHKTETPIIIINCD